MVRPHILEFPFQNNTEEIFSRIRHLPGAVWLDSGKPRSLQGRFDILSALPEFIITTEGLNTTVRSGSAVVLQSQDDPFNIATSLLQDMGKVDKEFAHFPFTGGLIGSFNYDLGYRVHGLPTPVVGQDSTDMSLGWYGWALVVNHQSSQAWLIFHPSCHPETRQAVSALLHDPRQSQIEDFCLTTGFSTHTDSGSYREAMAQIADYILSGDCYQVNYSLRHQAAYTGDPLQAYLLLRHILPSPYGAYLSSGDSRILCCSPERFLKVSVGQVETKPIKGTIARGKTIREDEDNAIALLNSKKDRAENLMIVDLLRNDLGKNCIPGTIRVPKLFALESFANVHHLVSTVTGSLAPHREPLDLLRDSFPGGSITGVPKKRAMEIIAELETVPRQIYCGSIGYISANGRMDTNIAIRTLLAREGQLYCWGGGGIVADSKPEAEYSEALQKVDLLMRTLENKFIKD